MEVVVIGAEESVAAGSLVRARKRENWWDRGRGWYGWDKERDLENLFLI